MSAVLRIARLVIVALLACFAIGFAVFAEYTTRFAPPDPPPRVDGVVALTGGGGARLSTGMALLDAGAGTRLLITGVNPSTTDDDIRRLARGSDAAFDCCVDVDRVARTTAGNAQEAAAWARRNGYGSLIVVTSDYHMPRALREIRRALSDVRLHAYPVHGAEVSGHPWWSSIGDARRMGVEYVKFVIIVARDTLGLRAAAQTPEPGTEQGEDTAAP